MALSQGNFSSGPAGMTLKAWVLLDGSTGNNLKSFNVNTVTRNSAGRYTITFLAVMAGVNYVGRMELNALNHYNGMSISTEISGKTTGSVQVVHVNQAATLVDAYQLLVAFYE